MRNGPSEVEDDGISEKRLQFQLEKCKIFFVSFPPSSNYVSKGLLAKETPNHYIKFITVVEKISMQ